MSVRGVHGDVFFLERPGQDPTHAKFLRMENENITTVASTWIESDETEGYAKSRTSLLSKWGTLIQRNLDSPGQEGVRVPDCFRHFRVRQSVLQRGPVHCFRLIGPRQCCRSLLPSGRGRCSLGKAFRFFNPNVRADESEQSGGWFETILVSTMIFQRNEPREGNGPESLNTSLFSAVCSWHFSTA